jgi:hypothetical protein
MEKQLSDESLAESAKYHYKNMCPSFIIATGIPPVRPPGRNYYHCDQGTKAHEIHRNGPDSWRIDKDTGNWVYEGDSLTDPNFTGANA